MNIKRKGAIAARLALVSILALLGILFVVSRSIRTYAQGPAPDHVRVSVTTDWTHRHLVYSRPASMMQTWRLQSEPRYIQQLQRRNAQPSQVMK